MGRADLLNEVRPVSLFCPGNDALGKIHAMSFKDGILIDCRVIEPGPPMFFKWIWDHLDDD